MANGTGHFTLRHTAAPILAALALAGASFAQPVGAAVARAKSPTPDRVQPAKKKRPAPAPPRGTIAAPEPYVGATLTPNGGGYTLFAKAGGVFTYGNAKFEGSAANDRLGATFAAAAGMPDGNGYWFVTDKGKLRAFGDAPSFGSVGKKDLHAPVTSIAAADHGRGYWILEADGTVVSFGAAKKLPHLPRLHPGDRAVSIVSTANGDGYWVATARGTLYARGNAALPSTVPTISPTTAVTSMTTTENGKGFWFVLSSGKAVPFGASVSHGSAKNLGTANPAVSIVARPGGGGYIILDAKGEVSAFGSQRNYGSGTRVPLIGPESVSTPTGTGVYGFFTTSGLATAAVRDGWRIIGDAGGLGIPNAPFVAEASGHPDLNVIDAISSTTHPINWLSFWTVSWPSDGTSYQKAGYDAGRQAAATLRSYSGSIKPNYVILDPEGFNEYNAASNYDAWKAFLLGWQSGLHSIDPNLQAGFYANQSQFEEFGLKRIPIPGFVAIAPIEGNRPSVSGGNIKGYIAYVASCPTGADLATMRTWHGQVNTVQFGDNGVDCGP